MKLKRLPDWPTDPIDPSDIAGTAISSDPQTVSVSAAELEEARATARRDQHMARLCGFQPQPWRLIVHHDRDPAREHESAGAACWCAPDIETIMPIRKP